MLTPCSDLHSSNLAFSLPRLDSWTVEQLHERLGQLETSPIERLDEKPFGPEAPPYVVKFIYPYRIFRESDTQTTKIIDLGEASFVTSERRNLGDTDNALYEMVTTLGPIPERWWEQWYGKFLFFRNDKSLRPDLIMDQNELEEKKLGTRMKRIREQRMEKFAGDAEVFYRRGYGGFTVVTRSNAEI